MQVVAVVQKRQVARVAQVDLASAVSEPELQHVLVP
jgi:hypothetical protein